MSKTTTLLAGLAFSAFLASAHAASVLSVPNVTAAPGSIVRVPVYITGNDMVVGADLVAQIGDGGWATGGTQDFPQAPQFLSFDLMGGIFDPAVPSGNIMTGYPAGATWEQFFGINGPVVGQGLLGTFTIQAGYEDGVWPLTLEVPAWGIPTTVFDQDFSAMETILVNGSITVPEPAAAGLLALGGMTLLRIRRRTR